MSATQYGYERIAKVETQEFRDELGRVDFAMIWVTSDEGDVFGRSLQVGESIEEVADRLRKRRCIDALCHLEWSKGDLVDRNAEAEALDLDFSHARLG